MKQTRMRVSRTQMRVSCTQMRFHIDYTHDAKEPLITGLFCGKWSIKIRHPTHASICSRHERVGVFVIVRQLLTTCGHCNVKKSPTKETISVKETYNLKEPTRSPTHPHHFGELVIVRQLLTFVALSHTYSLTHTLSHTLSHTHSLTHTLSHTHLLSTGISLLHVHTCGIYTNAFTYICMSCVCSICKRMSCEHTHDMQCKHIRVYAFTYRAHTRHANSVLCV